PHKARSGTTWLSSLFPPTLAEFDRILLKRMRVWIEIVFSRFAAPVSHVRRRAVEPLAAEESEPVGGVQANGSRRQDADDVKPHLGYIFRRQIDDDRLQAARRQESNTGPQIVLRTACPQRRNLTQISRGRRGINERQLFDHLRLTVQETVVSESLDLVEIGLTGPARPFTRLHLELEQCRRIDRFGHRLEGASQRIEMRSGAGRNAPFAVDPAKGERNKTWNPNVAGDVDQAKVEQLAPESIPKTAGDRLPLP